MFFRIAVVAGLVASMPALAQTAPQTPAAQGDIVVLGKSRGETDRQARDFVESIIPRSPSDQHLLRFEIDKVCPLVMGLTPSLDAAVTERLRHVAAAASVPLDTPDCRRASAMVLFADDIKPTIAMMEKRFVGLFLDEYGMPIHFAKKGPVVVWHLAQRVSQNGEVLGQDENGGTLTNQTARPGSRIESGSHPAFTTTIVLIDRHSVEGLTVTQVADYAAMRAFADTRPPSPDGAGDRPATILSAIEAPMGSAVPESLTKWDLGFLRGLYATSVNVRPQFQRGEVADAIARNATAAQR